MVRSRKVDADGYASVHWEKSMRRAMLRAMLLEMQVQTTKGLRADTSFKAVAWTDIVAKANVETEKTFPAFCATSKALSLATTTISSTPKKLPCGSPIAAPGHSWTFRASPIPVAHRSIFWLNDNRDELPCGSPIATSGHSWTFRASPNEPKDAIFRQTEPRELGAMYEPNPHAVPLSQFDNFR
ncbi:MAG: hypothetical protein L6R42_000927 [Xanthoria sp. 1 TBL-2021]|nr:MAG: hypothetical protein L6R42_000927 [Xanthoria sp. 1 TBL-2021]